MFNGVNHLQLMYIVVEFKIRRLKGRENRELERKTGKNANTVDFSEIVKKAYDKGVNENEITLEKLMEELKADLKQLVVC
jgi:hypothetical protein